MEDGAPVSYTHLEANKKRIQDNAFLDKVKAHAREIIEKFEIDGIDWTPVSYTHLLFTANGNFAPQKVERIASGGEISRVMLALKALLAHRMAVSYTHLTATV